MESITCNRCNKTITLKELAGYSHVSAQVSFELKWAVQEVKSWQRISLSGDAWGFDPLDDRISKRHLCPDCLALLEVFLAGGAVPECDRYYSVMSVKITSIFPNGLPNPYGSNGTTVAPVYEQTSGVVDRNGNLRQG